MSLGDFLNNAIIQDFCESCDSAYSVDLTDRYIGREQFYDWLPELVIKYIQDIGDDDLIELIIESLKLRGDTIKEELFKELEEMYAVKKLVLQRSTAREKDEGTSPE